MELMISLLRMHLQAMGRSLRVSSSLVFVANWFDLA